MLFHGLDQVFELVLLRLIEIVVAQTAAEAHAEHSLSAKCVHESVAWSLDIIDFWFFDLRRF